MKREMVRKRLTVILNDDMMKCAVEMGYKIPCVSISHYYGKKGIFKIDFKNGEPIRYELDIFDVNNKWQALYIIN